MSNRKRALIIAHVFLFVCFAIAAGAAVYSWLTSDELDGTVVGATVAAFFATTSTFLERLLPMDD